MSKIDVRADLNYEVRSDTVFLFQVAAAQTEHQTVIWEQLTIDPQLEVERYQVGLEGNQLHRLVVQPCDLRLSYQGNVELAPDVNRPTSVEESNLSEMPPEVLTYLNPSRYCQSDLLARFAFEEFGQMPRGFSRVQAICDWVFDQLDYTAGSTNSTTTAADVLLQRTGVCRDYAHLAITLCRGVGIPSRYVAGYALGLQPPDFHGFMEAFLDGHWYLFDPTRLSPVSGLVRIGVGRDAADVSFATLNGDAKLIEKTVWANHSDFTPHPIRVAAIRQLSPPRECKSANALQSWKRLSKWPCLDGAMSAGVSCPAATFLSDVLGESSGKALGSGGERIGRNAIANAALSLHIHSVSVPTGFRGVVAQTR